MRMIRYYKELLSMKQIFVLQLSIRRHSYLCNNFYMYPKPKCNFPIPGRLFFIYCHHYDLRILVTLFWKIIKFGKKFSKAMHFWLVLNPFLHKIRFLSTPGPALLLDKLIVPFIPFLCLWFILYNQWAYSIRRTLYRPTECHILICIGPLNKNVSTKYSENCIYYSGPIYNSVISKNNRLNR